MPAATSSANAAGDRESCWSNIRTSIAWLPILTPPAQRNCGESHNFESRLVYPAPRAHSLKFWDAYGTAEKGLGEHDFDLRRDGDVDIELRGVCLGEALFRLFRPGRQERGTAVSIYRSLTGRYAAMVQSLLLKDGIATDLAVSTVGLADNPRELVQWLKEREKGKLGLPSKAAAERASLVDPGFKDLLREHV